MYLGKYQTVKWVTPRKIYTLAVHQDSTPRQRRLKRTGLQVVAEFAMDMRVTVTTNVEIDIDITSGARGTTSSIILDEGKQQYHDGDESTVVLHYMPACILVELDRTHATQLEGLSRNVIEAKTEDESPNTARGHSRLHRQATSILHDSCVRLHRFPGTRTPGCTE
ncbi:uncharacterized protein STEHIDRAFT_107997 [Stereum hirsutum FP-91666 SS1]|uniref:uncharacterized protein n=1 Tax=Stereum hirsutum (strain FP-91666) TaxID=721885 RepID=UPI000440CA2B|nr:uncharacterized protein STEHIDRAFT_107997 [Stereum hirsutum FP-91666 SS1]EIM91446.1 hypothetical protein STEHIDRAFT_107997 [Stereum hirsutum FP-91666 SS1]